MISSCCSWRDRQMACPPLSVALQSRRLNHSRPSAEGWIERTIVIDGRTKAVRGSTLSGRAAVASRSPARHQPIGTACRMVKKETVKGALERVALVAVRR
jgi:hypothetical protein